MVRVAFSREFKVGRADRFAPDVLLIIGGGIFIGIEGDICAAFHRLGGIVPCI